jgi:4-carboxymuconolactone decarboxylase
MSRIPLTNVDEQPEPIRQFMARRGELNVFRLLANAPRVFVGWTQMLDELSDSATFSPRLRHVIILRVAHLQQSDYALSRHVALARAAGLTERQINAIVATDDFDGAGFVHAERAALDVVTELCSTHRLREDTFAAALATFGDEALVELLMIVSCYYGLAFVLNAVELDLDDTEGSQP